MWRGRRDKLVRKFWAGHFNSTNVLNACWRLSTVCFYIFSCTPSVSPELLSNYCVPAVGKTQVDKTVYHPRGQHNGRGIGWARWEGTFFAEQTGGAPPHRQFSTKPWHPATDKPMVSRFRSAEGSALADYNTEEAGLSPRSRFVKYSSERDLGSQSKEPPILFCGI